MLLFIKIKKKVYGALELFMVTTLYENNIFFLTKSFLKNDCQFNL